jgi:carbamoyltransferase
MVDVHGREMTAVDHAFFKPYRHLTVEDLRAVGVPRRFPMDDLWSEPVPTRALPDLAAAIDVADPLRQMGAHLPVTVDVRNRRIPGIFLQHHTAHAASSFFRSGYDSAMILTQDGCAYGPPFDSGGIFHGDGTSLWPVVPHYAQDGHFFSEVGLFLGLGTLSSPGKLMGLAPYGQPRFLTNNSFGNVADVEEQFGRIGPFPWLIHAITRLRDMGADLSRLGDTDAVTDPVNADLAASAQHILECNRERIARTIPDIAHRLGLSAENLCLSGGVALNCPANTRIWATGAFRSVFVEPCCEDGGLASGAALYLTHHLLQAPRVDDQAGFALPPIDATSHPCMGGRNIAAAVPAESVTAAIPGLEIDTVTNPARMAAADVVSGRLVGWVQGPAEIGPRSLGRRSLLADPCDRAMWLRVNQSKGREAWRPLAPAVLLDEAHMWFDGAPLPSPYMLFTARVLTSRLPAVTHVDGTARIQTVADADVPFADLLRHVRFLTGMGVVLNTSLNGPGDPIAETAEDSLAILGSGRIDVLYIGNRRYTVRGGGPGED